MPDPYTGKGRGVPPSSAHTLLPSNLPRRSHNAVSSPVRARQTYEPGNWYVASMAIFEDALYASTQNWTTGAEVWRTTNGTSWAQVNNDGFGDPDNDTGFSMAVFNGFLYLGTQNVETGCQVWRMPSRRRTA